MWPHSLSVNNREMWHNRLLLVRLCLSGLKKLKHHLITVLSEPSPGTGLATHFSYQAVHLCHRPAEEAGRHAEQQTDKKASVCCMYWNLTREMRHMQTQPKFNNSPL